MKMIVNATIHGPVVVDTHVNGMNALWLTIPFFIVMLIANYVAYREFRKDNYVGFFFLMITVTMTLESLFLVIA